MFLFHHHFFHCLPVETWVWLAALTAPSAWLRRPSAKTTSLRSQKASTESRRGCLSSGIKLWWGVIIIFEWPFCVFRPVHSLVFCPGAGYFLVFPCISVGLQFSFLSHNFLSVHFVLGNGTLLVFIAINLSLYHSICEQVLCYTIMEACFGLFKVQVLRAFTNSQLTPNLD